MEPVNSNYMMLTKSLALIISLGVFGTFAVTELPYAGRSTYAPIVKKMTVKDMAKESTVVVRGIVSASLGTIRQIGPAGDEMVYTRWKIQPTSAAKGTAKTDLVVRTAGGQYGLTIVDVEDQPALAVGQRVMLFLAPHPDWNGDYRIVGEFQGAYQVKSTNGQDSVTQSITNISEPVSVLQTEMQ